MGLRASLPLTKKSIKRTHTTTLPADSVAALPRSSHARCYPPRLLQTRKPKSRVHKNRRRHCNLTNKTTTQIAQIRKISRSLETLQTAPARTRRRGIQHGRVRQNRLGCGRERPLYAKEHVLGVGLRAVVQRLAPGTPDQPPDRADQIPDQARVGPGTQLGSVQNTITSE